VAATRFIQPQYQVSATIYVENTSGQSRSGPIRPEELLQNESWMQLIRSFAVLDPVVVRTKLYLTTPKEDAAAFERFELNKKFSPGRYRLRIDAGGQRYSLLTTQGAVLEEGAVGDSVGAKLGFLWMPPASALGRGREIAFAVRTPRAVSEELLSKLKTSMPGHGAFLNVSLDGSDPHQLASLLNTLVDQFVMVAANLKREKLADVTKDLTEQLRLADSGMRNAETSLESYRVNTITEPKLDQQFPLPSGLQQTQPTVMTNYFNKRIQRNSIQKDRMAIEDLLRRSQESGSASVDAFSTITTVRQAPDLMQVLGEISKTEAELRALRNRYTDEYKGIKDLLAKLSELNTRTLPIYANRLVDQLKSQENQLQNEIDNDSRELRQIPVRTHTEDKLQREATAAVALSQNLQNRLQEARLAELTATPDVGVLDRAEVPAAPSSSTAPRIILMGAVVSLVLALALALLLDRLDKRFRYPEQVSQGLGLTILGAVPVIRRGRGTVLRPDETAQIVESFRAIRVNLAHSFPDNEPILFTITSPSAGDGKSLVSANLAISFADAGYRTLLIDGDTRRGELFRMFGAERRPGLLDYLEGGISIDQTLRPTGNDRLTLLPSGTRTTRGPELLGSAAMVNLVKTLRSRFEVILVDSPPLGAGIDPFVLGTVTGGVVVVLRAGETDRELAEAKLQLMDRLPIRLIGAILNHIDVGKGSYKYYAYEYAYRPEAEGAASSASAPPALPTSS
jgi:capsular exopolysaccharide synthesis family protein